MSYMVNAFRSAVPFEVPFAVITDSGWLGAQLMTGASTTTGTFSYWFKRNVAGLSASNNFFVAEASSGSGSYVQQPIDSGNHLVTTDGAAKHTLVTTATYTDTTDWHHMCVVYDSSNATAGDRVRMYVDGVRVTVFSTETYPALNAGLFLDTYHNWFNAVAYWHQLKASMAEVVFVNNQALDASYFSDGTGVDCLPKEYSGTYDSLSYYLNFALSGASLGTDVWNGNNFTVNGTLTQTTTTPTNP